MHQEYSGGLSIDKVSCCPQTCIIIMVPFIPVLGIPCFISHNHYHTIHYQYIIFNSPRQMDHLFKAVYYNLTINAQL